VERPPAHARLLWILAGLFAIEFAMLAIAPLDRTTWMLENLLVALLLGAWLPAASRFVLSRVSTALLFAFLGIHEIGAHYTYSSVPYDAWFRALLGFSIDEALGWQRNHFDRAVHLLYGLLLAYPVREVFLRVADARGFWGYASPVGVTISFSALYEMLEWGAAWLFGGDVGCRVPRHAGG
jgi:putative membrane protein